MAMAPVLWLQQKKSSHVCPVLHRRDHPKALQGEGGRGKRGVALQKQQEKEQEHEKKTFTLLQLRHIRKDIGCWPFSGPYPRWVLAMDIRFKKCRIVYLCEHDVIVKMRLPYCNYNCIVTA